MTITRLFFAAISAAGLLAATAAHATTIGNTLSNRASLDSGLGSLFAGEVFGFDRGTLTEWTIRSTAAAYGGTRNITPVILEQTGVGALGAVTVRGIGTTRTLAHSAASQTFDFGLTSGSAAMGPRRYIGWIDSDGGAAAAGKNAGVISFGATNQTLWFGAPAGGISTGASFGVASNLNRTYSLQATIDIGKNEFVGNSARQRANVDGGTGLVWVMDDAFTQPGKVDQWAIWSFTSGSNAVTPLIFEDVAGDFILRGVGTTRIPTSGEGTQTYDFGLVSGSSQVDSDYYLGWADASIAADGTPTYNGANARYSTGEFGSSAILLGGSPAFTFTPGLNAGAGTAFARQYSVQAIAVHIPEPSTLVLAVFGLVGIAAVRRRRTRA